MALPVVVRRQAPMAQTVLGSPAVAVHRQDRRDPCPDAEADPSGSNDSRSHWQYTDEEVEDPAWQDRASPTSVIRMADNAKTVEIPQAQLTDGHARCDTQQALGIQKCSRPWSSHRSSTDDIVDVSVVMRHPSANLPDSSHATTSASDTEGPANRGGPRDRGHPCATDCVGASC